MRRKWLRGNNGTVIFYYLSIIYNKICIYIGLNETHFERNSPKTKSSSPLMHSITSVKKLGCQLEH